MKTFKDLQDEVLNWMADGADTGLLRDLVKSNLNRVHTRLLTSTQWNFMLWPRVETITVTSQEKFYSLHPLYQTPLFFYNPETDEYLEQIDPRGIMESEEDWQDGELASPERFSITTLSGVMAQPATAGVVEVATSGGAESSANSIVVRGISSGEEVEEELTGSTWTSLTGTVSFDKVLDITKVGSSWTRDITITSGSTTLLSLKASEFGKQFRQFELLRNPTTSSTILYRFFQRPKQLSRDNDIPQLPNEFSEILVFDCLLKMQGFARSTGEELLLFKQNYDELLKELRDTYKLTTAVGARPRYIQTIPRL